MKSVLPADREIGNFLMTHLRDEKRENRLPPLTGAAADDGASGVSLVELMLVLAVATIIIAIAVPQALKSVKNYRLHADTTSVVSYLNLTRMRAASQYAPYRLDFDPATNTYRVEQLAASQYNPIPTSTPSPGPYSAQSPPAYEYGTQYLSTGDSFANCRPTGISAYPGSITADPSTCTGAFQIYFNTRGTPVDSSGNTLVNGGLAVYLTGANSLTDAVTVSASGAVQVWNWNPGNSQWYAR
jgi:type II secretory pathway pseudopilin PulG